MKVKELVQKLAKLDQDLDIVVKNNYDVDPANSIVLKACVDDGKACICIDNSTMLLDIDVFGLYNWKSHLAEKFRDQAAQAFKSQQNLNYSEFAEQVRNAFKIEAFDPKEFMPPTESDDSDVD